MATRLDERGHQTGVACETRVIAAQAERTTCGVRQEGVAEDGFRCLAIIHPGDDEVRRILPEQLEPALQVDVVGFAIRIKNFIAECLQQQLQLLRGVESPGEFLRRRAVERVKHLDDLIRDRGEDRVLRIGRLEAAFGEDITEETGERGTKISAGERLERAINPREAGGNGARPFGIAEHPWREFQRVIERVGQRGDRERVEIIEKLAQRRAALGFGFDEITNRVRHVGTAHEFRHGTKRACAREL